MPCQCGYPDGICLPSGGWFSLGLRPRENHPPEGRHSIRIPTLAWHICIMVFHALIWTSQAGQHKYEPAAHGTGLNGSVYMLPNGYISLLSSIQAIIILVILLVKKGNGLVSAGVRGEGGVVQYNNIQIWHSPRVTMLTRGRLSRWKTHRDVIFVLLYRTPLPPGQPKSMANWNLQKSLGQFNIRVAGLPCWPCWDVVFVLSYRTNYHLNWVEVILFSLNWDTHACYFLSRCTQQ